MLLCGRSPTEDEVSLTAAPPARRQTLGVGLIPPEKSARGAGEPAKQILEIQKHWISISKNHAYLRLLKEV